MQLIIFLQLIREKKKKIRFQLSSGPSSPPQVTVWIITFVQTACQNLLPLSKEGMLAVSSNKNHVDGYLILQGAPCR